MYLAFLKRCSTSIFRVLPYEFNSLKMVSTVSCEKRIARLKQRPFIPKNHDRNNSIPNTLRSVTDQNDIRLLMRDLNLRLSNFNRINRCDIEKILKISLSAGELTEMIGLQLLQSCGDILTDQTLEQKVDLIWKIWNTLKENNVVSLTLYHGLLISLSVNGQSINPESILNEIVKHGFKPTDVTHCLILNCLCESGNMENAVNFLNRMKHQRIPADETTFNSLAFLYANNGDIANAFNLLKIMKSKSIRVTSKTYCSLLRGTAEQGDEENFNLLREKINAEENITLTEIDTIAVLYSLSKGQLYWLIPIILGDVDHLKNKDLQKLINFCTRLLYSNMHKAAFIILNSLDNHLLATNSENKSYVEYLVKEMIESNTPIDDVLKFCEQLRERCPFILLSAGHAALSNSLHHQKSYKIFQAMKQSNLPIRPHYFWPLIISAAKSNGEKGVLSVLQRMDEYGIRADFETLDDYAFQYMDLQSPAEVIKKLQDAGFQDASVITPLISRYIRSHQLKKALETCYLHRTKIYHGYFDRYLVSAFSKTHDIQSTVDLVKYLADSDSGASNFIIALLKRNTSSLTPSLLKTLVQTFQNANLAISWSAVDSIRKYMRRIGVEEGEEEFLNSLMNKGVTVSNEKPKVFHPVCDMDVKQLEEHLIEQKKRNLNTRGILRRLLIIYSSLGNIQRVRDLLMEIEKNQYEMSPGMRASLVEVFARHDDVENAIRILNQLKTEQPDFKIEPLKYVNLAIALLKKGQFKGAIDLLEQAKPDDVELDAMSQKCWIMLNASAEYCTSDQTNDLLNFLVSRNYCSYGHQLLSPLIRSYLLRNDVDGAVDEFLECVNKYGACPMKFELLCQLISNEDGKYCDRLENVLTACYSVSGVEATYVSYITALAEMNQMEKLNKFLLDSHFAVNMKMLSTECERLRSKNKINTLLNIAKAFEIFPTLNADTVYLNILKFYNNVNDYESGLKLLSHIEQINRIPPKEFYEVLSKLLQSNNQEVPFCV